MHFIGAVMRFRAVLSKVYWKMIRRLLGIRGDQFILPALQVQKAHDARGAFNNNHIRQSADVFLSELKKAQISMNAMRNFQELRDARELRVELGGGADSVRAGWINIDLFLSEDGNDASQSRDGSAYINHDLRLGLPLPDGSCKFIYSSHFFEHLEHIDALTLLKDCYRCLQAGGRLRLALPDYRPSFVAYLNGDYEYFRAAGRKRLAVGVQAGEETLADFLSLGIYERGQHKYIYDPEKCIKLLSQIGFRRVSESAFLDEIDIVVRRPYTFYMEAIK